MYAEISLSGFVIHVSFYYMRCHSKHEVWMHTRFKENLHACGYFA